MDIPAQLRRGRGTRRASTSMTPMLRFLACLCCCLAVIGCGSPPPAADAKPAAAPAQDPAQAPVADPLPATPQLPDLAPDQYEWHGQWQGEPFWARLGPHDPTYGGRILQVVYTQPAAAALGGTMLAPHPWLLLGEDHAISAWLERSRLSRAEYRSDDQPPGYRVTRESERQVGDDVFLDERSLRIPGPRGWDRRMAPLLLSLLWQAESSGSVAVYDLFAVDSASAALRWEGAEASLGETDWRIEAGPQGRLQRLLANDGTPILSVAEHLPLVPAAEALERERAFQESLGGD